MSRQAEIKWTKADEARLRKAQRNARDKSRRLLAKEEKIKAGELPRPVGQVTIIKNIPTLTQLKSQIKTRDDLRNVVADLRSYSAKGGEYATIPGGIKWGKRNTNTLNRAMNNYNKKIDMLAKADPTNKAALPPKLTMKQMKDAIHTQDDFTREVNALKGFMKKGAETLVDMPLNNNNLKITRWQKEQMEMRAQAITDIRKSKREMIAGLEVTDRGEKVGYRRGDIGMGKASELSMRDMEPFYKTMSHFDARERFLSMLRESGDKYWNYRDLLLRENYIREMEKNFNGFNDEIREMVDAIRNMSLDQFRKIFEAEGGDFDFVYPHKSTNGNIDDFVVGLQQTWLPKSKPQEA